MSIGLKRGQVAIENYQIEWEISANNIINLLKNTLKDDIVDAQHIGSTAIKSISFDVVIFISKDWNVYINMSDYLNSNEEKAKEYSNLKKQLAKKYPNDRIAYTQGKSKIIEEILESAKNKNY